VLEPIIQFSPFIPWGFTFDEFSKAYPRLKDLKGPKENSISATPEAIEIFIAQIVAEVPDQKKRALRDRLRARLIVDIQNDDTAALAKFWKDCAVASVSSTKYGQQLATFLRDLACNARNNRKAIVTGVVRFRLFSWRDQPDFPRHLARGLLELDGQHCAAAKDLKDLDEAKREELAAIATAVTPVR